MKVAAVIPCRWASRRFPGKPVAPILGRPMVAWVIDAALQAGRVQHVIVATDDQRIAEAAAHAGAQVRMTSSAHPTGTDRVAEAVKDLSVDVVLGIQGDEPMIQPGAIDALAQVFEDAEVQLATLAIRGATEEERNDPHLAKIVVDDRGDAMYFSRAAIPFRNLAAGCKPLAPGQKDLDTWRHVGSYGFRKDVLLRLVQEPRTGLEAAEDLEQLRALRLGWKFRIVEIALDPVCVDVPQDVVRVESLLRARREESLR
jgi:3-deoxy-manno-octulosonate cytidylyltransferase (CMP-KDO synthetase)